MFVRDLSGENVFFEKFRLKKSVNRHGKCRLRAFADEDACKNWLGRVGGKLYVAPENDTTLPVFCGIITRAGMEKNIGSTILDITAISPSLRLDETRQARLFQNPDKTFGDILEGIDTGDCGLQLDEEFKNTEYKPAVLQADETDFAFLLRMANAGGTRLWINDQNEDSPAIRIGPSLTRNSRKLAEDRIISLCEYRNAQGRAVRLSSQDNFEPGSLLTLGEDSTVYLVLDYELATVHGMDIFTYKLEEAGKSAPQSPQPGRQTAILQGTVADTGDPENLGRIRVDFEGVEDECPADKKLWLPFRPAWAGKGSGTVFVPDKGDHLEVIFVNGELYASSTLRKDELLEECRNVADKYIGNNSSQRIFWKEKSLELMSSENRIYMDEDKIEITVGDNVARVDRDGITLKTPDNEIRLDSKGAAFTSRGDCSSKVKGDWSVQSDGKAGIRAQSDLEVRGASVNIKAESGSVNIGTRVKLGN